jgi:hypothetical protein
MIPQSYQQWLNCIINECNITLTKALARERLAVYQRPEHPQTKAFVQLYGTRHLNNIINWYRFYEQQ